MNTRLNSFLHGFNIWLNVSRACRSRPPGNPQGKTAQSTRMRGTSHLGYTPHRRPNPNGVASSRPRIHAARRSTELRFGALNAGFDLEKRPSKHSPNDVSQPSATGLCQNRMESRDSLRAGSMFGAPIAWLRLTRLLLLATLLACAFPTFAQWTSQTFTLRPGWNAIYLEVQPEPKDCDTLFSGIAVESAWAWNRRFSSIQFIQDPNELIVAQPNWLTYLPPTNPSRATMNLYTLDAGHAYLVKLAVNATPVTWTVRGRPVLHAPTWLSDSYNLVGFPVDPVSPPTFQNFFASSPAHAGKPVYRLNTAGGWEKITSPSSTTLRSGEAYWVRCDGPSTWSGPQTVVLERSAGLDYGRTLVEQIVRIQNNSASTRTFTVRTLPSASPPTSTAAPLAGDVPLSFYRFDPASTNSGWTPLPSQLSQANLAPGEEWAIRLAVRRADLTPFTSPPGKTEGLYQTLLEINDGVGSRCTLPVSSLGSQRTSAAGPLGGGGSGGSGGGGNGGSPFVGLWVGNVVITNVSRPANTASPTFSVADITNFSAFATRLKSPGSLDVVSSGLRSKLSTNTFDLLTAYQGNSDPTPLLKSSLIDDLNSIIAMPPTSFSANEFINLPSLVDKLRSPTTLTFEDINDLPALAAKLNSHTTISVNDFLDLPTLASNLKQPPDDKFTYLASLLSPASRSALAPYLGSASDPTYLRITLAADFNRIIRGDSISGAPGFAGHSWGLEADSLITQGPLPGDDALRRLNRLLLEASCTLRPADAVSVFLKGQLSPPTFTALTNYQGSGSNLVLQVNLVRDFNTIIGGSSIFLNTRFAGIDLRPETATLQATQPTLGSDDLRRLNRLLLEDSCPLRKADPISIFLRSQLAGVTAPPLTDLEKYGSWMFSVDNFTTDLPSLASKLKQPAGSDLVSPYLTSQFSAATLAALAAYPVNPDPAPLQTALAKDLNWIIRGPSLYDAQRFNDVLLGPATQELLAQNPHGDALVHLNRLLLADALGISTNAYLALASDFVIQAELATGINEIMAFTDARAIYSVQLGADRFAGVALRQETQQLLARIPAVQDDTLLRLKRLLLEDAYPLEIVRTAIGSIYDWGFFSGIPRRSETETLRLRIPPPTGSDLIHLNRLLLEDAYTGQIALSPTTAPTSQAPGSEFQFRLIVHVDANKNANLLQKVIQVWTNGTYGYYTGTNIFATNSSTTNFLGNQYADIPGSYQLFTDENQVTNSPPWARRISSAAFGFKGKLLFGNSPAFGVADSLLTNTVTIGYDDPLNPFKHRYHPDHDNLDERFEQITPDTESFNVLRNLTLTFKAQDPSGPNPPDWGSDQVGGIYEETIRGLHRNDLYVSGTFHLRRLTSTGTLQP